MQKLSELYREMEDRAMARALWDELHKISEAAGQEKTGQPMLSALSPLGRMLRRAPRFMKRRGAELGRKTMTPGVHPGSQRAAIQKVMRAQGLKKAGAAKNDRPYQGPVSGAVRGGILGGAVGGLYGAGATRGLASGSKALVAKGMSPITKAMIGRGALAGAVFGGALGTARAIKRKLKGKEKNAAVEKGKSLRAAAKIFRGTPHIRPKGITFGQ